MKTINPSITDLNQLLHSKCDVVVCFSGGKDSVATVLMLLSLGIAKHRIVLHHQNVDGDGDLWFDWSCTRSYCEAFALAFGLRYLEQYREGGIMAEIQKENAALARIEMSMEEEIGDLGANLFGLFNGVTHFTTHRYKKEGYIKNAEILGTQARINQKAFNFVEEHIKRRTLVTV